MNQVSDALDQVSNFPVFFYGTREEEFIRKVKIPPLIVFESQPAQQHPDKVTYPNCWMTTCVHQL